MSVETFDLADGALPPADDHQGWILANPEHYGYYICNYDDANWLALAAQLKKDHTVTN